MLVANAGAPELALFDPAGRFVRAIGRKGRGPGEFHGPISVFEWRADSVAVYDPAAVRWTILDPALTRARTAPAPDPDIRQPTWLYRGTIVSDGVLRPIPSWITGVLDRARQADPGYARLGHGRRDDMGALWIRDSTDRRRWAIYSGTGIAVATVTLPDGLEPLHIGREFVLGVVRDSLDVEQLRVHALERTGGAPGPSVLGDDGAPLPGDSAVLNAFPRLLIAQEGYYSTHAAYAPNADSLGLSPPFPFRLFILSGDARRWSAVAVRLETGATCGLSVGWPSPVGWLDGTPFCGR